MIIRQGDPKKPVGQISPLGCILDIPFCARLVFSLLSLRHCVSRLGGIELLQVPLGQAPVHTLSAPYSLQIPLHLKPHAITTRLDPFYLRNQD